MGQLLRQRILVLHGLQNLLARQLLPGGGDDDCLLVVLPQEGNRCVELFLGDRAGTAEDDGRGRFDLIGVEFAEIFHIDFAFVSVGHGDKAAKL